MRLDPVLGPEDLSSVRPVVIVDARSGKDAAERFAVGHLRGAVHVDLDRDLSEKAADPREGGRHPLPPCARFAELLARLGIGAESRVAIYDDKGGANAAARFWWMLRATGHEAVQIVDGGLDAALAAGVPAERGPGRAPAPVPARPLEWRWPVVQADEVARAASDPSRLVVDVRDPSRYRGEGDPFDPTTGHIPGAVNVPFATNLGADGRFLSTEALAAKYRALLGSRAPSDVVVQCGSGVTACHTLAALERAGLPGARLYVGSWSEWSRAGRPVATGSDPHG